MTSALIKDLFIEIKRTFPRYISILLLVTLGVSFYSGIRATSPDMKITADKYYDQQNLMDFRIVSTMGLTKNDLSALQSLDSIQDASGGFSMDALCYFNQTESILKVISMQSVINKLVLMDGRLPQKNNECVMEETFLVQNNLKIGDTIDLESGTQESLSDSLHTDKFTVVGTVRSPYYISIEYGTTSIGTGNIDSFLYVPANSFSMGYFTEIYLTCHDSDDLLSFSNAYEDMTKDIADELEVLSKSRNQARYEEITSAATNELRNAKRRLNMIKDQITEQEFQKFQKQITQSENQMKNIEYPKWYILNRDTIPAYVGYDMDSQRIAALGTVFPAIFFLVAALVCLTTMTRMVEEQRTQIGTLKSLGYSKSAISMKYLLYALSATLIGSIIGFTLGQKFIPVMIFDAYAMMYKLPHCVTPIHFYYSFTSTLAAVLCTTAAALFACVSALHTEPATLMRPLAPANGQKILLERISFIWSRFQFTGKVTARNLFRYKKRFLMTIFGIGGCTGLVITGFGLQDSIYAMLSNQYEDLFHYDVTISLDDNADMEQQAIVDQSLSNNSLVKDFIHTYSSAVNCEGQSATESANLVVIDNAKSFSKYVSLRNRRSDSTLSLSHDGVIITEKLAKLLSLKVGDKITLEDEDLASKDAVVEGITENYIYHYVYMSASLYTSLYDDAPSYNQIYALTSDDVYTLQTDLSAQLLKLSAVNSVNFLADDYDDMNRSMDSLTFVVIVIIIAAGALAFVVLYNLNNINITERKRELATIKVLGFYDVEVSAYIYRENIFLTLLGIGLGFIMGALLHRFVIDTAEMNAIMFGQDIKLLSYILGGFISALFSAMINVVMHFNLKNINMVESLKSVE